MAYSKDLVIILVIMLSNKLKNIKQNIIKTFGNLKPITFASLVSIKSVKTIICSLNYLLFLLHQSYVALTSYAFFPDYTFLMLHFFHVPIFPGCIYRILYLFMFSIHCTLPMLHLSHVSFFSCCTLSCYTFYNFHSFMLRFFHFAFFHVALFYLPFLVLSFPL